MNLKQQCKRMLAVLATAAMLFAAIPATGFAESTEASAVSCGLAVLSARTDVALSAMVGNDVLFTADDFARGMNLSEVRFLTVKSLPENTDGELLLGSSRVAAGQTVAAGNLSAMCFHPFSADVRHASFVFTVNGSAVPMLCNLYLLEARNDTPTVSMASGLSLQNTTYRNLAVYGKLSAYDPDGDELRYEIVSYPENGTVTLTAPGEGSYVYRPEKGYVGTDSFTYVARDLYGNYSASATVSLRVDLSGTSVTYADLAESQMCAAMTVTEKGIMSGTQIGDRTYFYPDAQVTRAEFLVMAMNAAGIAEVPDVEQTVFADDAEIPETMKGYVSAAYQIGIVSGTQKDGKLCFLPNEPLTRAQAAVMLEKLLKPASATVVPVFADTSEIPVWAKEAVFSLNAAGILTSTEGHIAPSAVVTRAQTAELLTAVLRYGK